MKWQFGLFLYGIICVFLLAMYSAEPIWWVIPCIIYTILDGWAKEKFKNRE